MSEPKKKVAVYVRSATGENFGNNTVDIQLEALRKHAVENNYEIIDEYVDVASGITLDRLGFKKLLGDAEENLFDMVLIYNISSLARNISIHLDIEDRLRKLGINIKSVEDGAYPSDKFRNVPRRSLA